MLIKGKIIHGQSKTFHGISKCREERKKEPWGLMKIGNLRINFISQVPDIPGLSYEQTTLQDIQGAGGYRCKW